MFSQLLQVAASQQGVFTDAQAAWAGVTRAMLRTRVRSGDVVRMAHGAYRVVGAPITWRQRVQAAVLVAGTEAAASHHAAAVLWGLPGFREGPIHVVRPAGSKGRTRIGSLHETNALPRSHVRNVDGIPVTSPERTCLDLCGVFRGRRRRRAEVAVANMLRKDLTSLGRLAGVLAEVGGRGRPGSDGLRRIVAKLDDGQPITESELEDLVVKVLTEAGLALPRRQVRVGGTTAPIGRLDFLYAPRLVIEANSRAHHGQWLDEEADAIRDMKLAAAGYDVVRVTWRILVDHPEVFVAAVKAKLDVLAA